MYVNLDPIDEVSSCWTSTTFRNSNLNTLELPTKIVNTTRSAWVDAK